MDPRIKCLDTKGTARVASGPCPTNVRVNNKFHVWEKRMKLYSCTLPMPPSANNLFTGKSRRRRSDEYEAWINHCMLILKNHPKITQPVRITYNIFFKNAKGGDNSNRVKAPEDILVKRGILPDDSHKWIVGHSVEWCGYDKQNPRVEISIYPAGAA